MRTRIVWTPEERSIIKSAALHIYGNTDFVGSILAAARIAQSNLPVLRQRAKLASHNLVWCHPDIELSANYTDFPEDKLYEIYDFISKPKNARYESKTFQQSSTKTQQPVEEKLTVKEPEYLDEQPMKEFTDRRDTQEVKVRIEVSKPKKKNKNKLRVLPDRTDEVLAAIHAQSRKTDELVFAINSLPNKISECFVNSLTNSEFTLHILDLLDAVKSRVVKADETSNVSVNAKQAEKQKEKIHNFTPATEVSIETKAEVTKTQHQAKTIEAPPLQMAKGSHAPTTKPKVTIIAAPSTESIVSTYVPYTPPVVSAASDTATETTKKKKKSEKPMLLFINLFPNQLNEIESSYSTDYDVRFWDGKKDSMASLERLSQNASRIYSSIKSTRHSQDEKIYSLAKEKYVRINGSVSMLKRTVDKERASHII